MAIKAGRASTRAFAALTLAGLGCVAAPPAFAQTAETGNEAPVVYPPDFFARYAPRTALDMVRQVPGFSIDEADEDRRGFSGATGNVRIDGAQPSAKSQSLEDILARIPVADVVRIELLRGQSAPGVSAQSTFLNVVRRPGAGGSTVWTLGAEMTESRGVSPQAEAASSRSFGDIDVSLGLQHVQERFVAKGGRELYDGAGALRERQIEREPNTERESSLSAEIGAPFAGGELTLTGQASLLKETNDLATLRVSAAGAPAGFRDNQAALEETTYEGGLAYEREFGAWTLELTGLATRSNEDQQEAEVERTAAGAFDESANQTIESESGETIGRFVVSRELGGFDISFGAEAALNTLEQRLRLVEDTGSGPVPVVLPSANVRVEEERAEGFLTVSFKPASNFTLEGTAAAETSTLTQSGDVNQTTELTYWKPSVQGVYRFGQRNQARLRFYRDIGQLDFGDFVSAAEISNNLIVGGNPDLRPETSWRLEFATDWRFGAETTFEVTLFRWWADDVIDVIPVGPPGAQFDAPGNIGKADVYGVRAAFSTPLPVLPGARFDAEASVQESETRDPLTGAKRSVSEFEELNVSLSFRQDLPARKFSWGARYEIEESSPTFRLDEIQTERDSNDWEVFAETTALTGFTTRVWVRKLTGPPQKRVREFFDPDRLGALDRVEQRRLERGVAVGASLASSF